VTVIYLDTLLLLNWVVDYCLLAAAARLGGEPMRRVRLALAAALGAGYAGLAALPPLAVLSHPVGQAAAGVLLVVAAYGNSDRLVHLGGLFLVLACAFAGGLMALSLAQGKGTVGISLRGTLIAAALCYGALTLVLGRSFAHRQTAGETQPITFTHRGRSVTLLALVDTGNTLSDPLTGRPVVVVEGEKLAPLLPELAPLTRERLSDPAALLGEGGRRLGLRLLPYRAVGVAWGLLLALRLDQVALGGRTLGSCLAALSPTPLSDGGGYSALVSAGILGAVPAGARKEG
jgi:stage II sporulation protein GA (sporulation sigma-E factor processing peptidase)